ncbi:hypothetical protein HY407_03040 [Candidatus Gottesmanbacteria bacterium]|nr:hypothetical protein [Candidatus Gottesmanbacteria bacterium]
MFIPLFAFFIILLSIFLISPRINTIIYQTVFLLTRSKKISLGILILFLLPGTIIHEFSHFIVATILFVPTTSMTIIPKIEGGIIKAGSLHHTNTDPIRLSLIGLAPMIIGIALIYIIGNLFSSQISNFKFQISNFILLITNYYLLITLSLSMFSSRKDLEVTWFLAPLIFLLFAVLYYQGIRISLTLDLSSQLKGFLQQLNIYFLITLILDLGVFLLLRGMKVLLEKILKVKVISSTYAP